MLRTLHLARNLRAVLIALAYFALFEGVASAATYATFQSRTPSVDPNSAQTVSVVATSNTAYGENVWVQYHVVNSGTWPEAICTPIAYDGGSGTTTWQGSVPAFRAGTQVQFQFFVKYPDNHKDQWSGYESYTVTDQSVAAAAAVHSAPTAYAGNVYFGSDDGKLYGYDLDSQAALTGFPFDATAEAGAGAKILGRASLRGIGGQVYLFFITDNGYVFRLHLNGDGTLDTTTDVPKSYRPDSTASNVSTTPAVFPIGPDNYIFAAINTSAGAKLCKIPESTMDSSTSYLFGTGTSVTSSPAGDGGANVYVGLSGGGTDGMFRINAANLDLLASFANGKTVSGSPFISGTTHFGLSVPTMYVGTDDGDIYAVNATNGNPVVGFDGDGIKTVAAGQPLTSLFLSGTKLYTTGATNGIVYQMNPATGAIDNTYNVVQESGGKVPYGVALDPKDNGYIVWGTDNGRFYQVDETNFTNKRIHTLATDAQGFTTAPAIDAASGLVMAGNTDGKVYIYPR